MEEELTIIKKYMKTRNKPIKRITIEKTETKETLEGPPLSKSSIEKCPTCKQYYIPTLKK